MTIGLPVVGSFAPRRWQALLRASGTSLDSVTFVEDGVACWRVEREGGPAPWSRVELRQTSRGDLRVLARLIDSLAEHDDMKRPGAEHGDCVGRPIDIRERFG